MDREKALELLYKYNSEPFLILHGKTVEGVMRYFARTLGYGDEEEFWGMVGLLHDVDYGTFPNEHCVKAPELLREIGADERFIHAVCSHGYGLTLTECQPTTEMEKVLFAVDELTGLIGASVRMRPSKSTLDMDVSSLKKKFKDKHFASGCSREVIAKGAEQLGWELEKLLEQTLLGMQDFEKSGGALI